MSLSPYGLLELPLWGYALVTFLTIQTMFLGVTLYLHRDQSHGGLILHRALRHVFRFWLWFSSGAVTRQWVAVHRRHHALADQQGDPHSPVVFGLRRVVFEGYELYKDAARDPETLRNYGRGTPEDWIERHLYSAHPLLGLVVFSAVHLLLFGVPAVVMLAVHLVAQPFFAGGVINGLGHAVGYRSFEMPTTATNLVPWALLLGGEELHNNHHAFPRSARFSVQRWEIDIGWLWIRLFDALGLAKVRWVAPRPHFERRRRGEAGGGGGGEAGRRGGAVGGAGGAGGRAAARGGGGGGGSAGGGGRAAGAAAGRGGATAGPHGSSTRIPNQRHSRRRRAQGA